jgi:hypothetical protein
VQRAGGRRLVAERHSIGRTSRQLKNQHLLGRIWRMLLGVIALRHEGKLEYDPDKMRITNNNEANKLLKPTFRKGWEFHTVKA